MGNTAKQTTKNRKKNFCTTNNKEDTGHSRNKIIKTIQNKNKRLKKTLNKKIKFNDSGEEEVVERSSQTNENSPFTPEEEATVKDEDIDQFCDELNEEDNEQYESWVKLIEEKLGANKK